MYILSDSEKFIGLRQGFFWGGGRGWEDRVIPYLVRTKMQFFMTSACHYDCILERGNTTSDDFLLNKIP